MADTQDWALLAQTLSGNAARQQQHRQFLRRMQLEQEQLRLAQEQQDEVVRAQAEKERMAQISGALGLAEQGAPAEQLRSFFPKLPPAQLLEPAEFEPEDRPVGVESPMGIPPLRFPAYRKQEATRVDPFADVVQGIEQEKELLHFGKQAEERATSAMGFAKTQPGVPGSKTAGAVTKTVFPRKISEEQATERLSGLITPTTQADVEAEARAKAITRYRPTEDARALKAMDAALKRGLRGMDLISAGVKAMADARAASALPVPPEMYVEFFMRAADLVREQFPVEEAFEAVEIVGEPRGVPRIKEPGQRDPMAPSGVAPPVAPSGVAPPVHETREERKARMLRGK